MFLSIAQIFHDNNPQTMRELGELMEMGYGYF